jgi:hypothetical protein
MKALIQLKKATPLFGITLVLACFALSPQAFAQAATPTFTPNQWCGCRHYKNVTISSTTSGGGIFVLMRNTQEPYDQVGFWITNPGTIPVGYLGKKTLQAFHTSNPPTSSSQPTQNSGLGYSGTYKYRYRCTLPCPTGKSVFLVIGGIVLAAVLIIILRRAATGRISVRDADADAPKL